MNSRSRILLLGLGAIVLIVGLVWWSQNKEVNRAPTGATQSPASSATQSPAPSQPMSQPATDAGAPRPVPAPEGSNSCCDVVANPALTGRLGRLVVSFPQGTNAGNTRIDVFRPGEQASLAGGYGGHTFELLPGAYDVEISKKRLTGVPIKSAHDTKVKVGVLRINAGGNTRVDLLDVTGHANLTGGFGNQQFGLPIGAFQVKVAGQAETVKIEDGKVTEF